MARSILHTLVGTTNCSAPAAFLSRQHKNINLVDFLISLSSFCFSTVCLPCQLTSVSCKCLRCCLLHHGKCLCLRPAIYPGFFPRSHSIMQRYCQNRYQSLFDRETLGMVAYPVGYAQRIPCSLLKDPVATIYHSLFLNARTVFFGWPRYAA